MIARLAVAFLLLLGAAGAARAQALTADLSNHLIAITTGFTGTSGVLFGATDGAGDVIAVVRGPEREIVVRHKSRIAGIWVNTSSLGFSGAPAFYAVYSSRPLADIMAPEIRAQHRIGLDNLRLTAAGADPAEIATLRSALIEEQERQGLYAKDTGKISFLGNRLFRATLEFPANVPTGNYLVEVFLVRNGNVVSGQTTPLTVSEAGIDAEVNEIAQRQALLYGLVAVMGAAMAGWLGSLAFRKV
jgi:uncharacterized protein (TIGR02186 family)